MKNNELIKFLKPNSKFLLLGIILLLFPLISGAPIFIALLCFGLGGLMIWIHRSQKKSMKRLSEDLEQTGQMEVLLADFTSARSMADGKVRLGTHHIYARGSAELLAYEDIQRIEIRSKSGNSTPVCYDSKKIPHSLVSFSSREVRRGDLILLITAIQAKNARIQLG